MFPSKRSFGLFFCCVVSLLAMACGTFQVRTDWDRDADFQAMRSFRFESPPEATGTDPFADNTLIRKRVRKAVEGVLAERGYRAADAEEVADFTITFAVLLEDQYSVQGTSAGFGWGLGRRGRRLGTDAYSERVSPRQESTLLLDVKDPETGNLIWRGWGDGIVQTRDRARSEERLVEGVRAILARFPPESEVAGKSDSNGGVPER